MKNAHLFTFLFVVIAGTLSGQAYFTAGGLRFGDGIGLTLQQRITKKSTIEGTLQGRLGEDQVRLTGLYERHFPIITRNLNIYLGAGVYKDWEQDTYLEVMPDPFGLAFVGGAELTLGRLNFSVDFRPHIQLSQLSEFNFDSQVGVSARYVLIRGKTIGKGAKKKKKKKKKKGNDGFDWNIFN